MPTYRRALVPLTFWRHIRMSFPVMPRRLVQFAAEMLLTLHVIAAYTMMAGADGVDWPRRLFRAPTPEWYVQVAAIVAWPYREWSITTIPPPAGFVAWGPVNHEVPAAFDAPSVVALGWFVLTPVSFVLLRRSMREAKVRAGHLLRGGVYSLAIVPLVVGAYLVLRLPSLSIWSTRRANSMVDEALSRYVLPLLNGVMPIWMWLWCVAAVWLIAYWYAVARHYMRLKHGLGVACAMVLIGGLVSILGLLLLDVEGTVNMFFPEAGW